jgi:hypothetical protein
VRDKLPWSLVLYGTLAAATCVVSQTQVSGADPTPVPLAPGQPVRIQVNVSGGATGKPKVETSGGTIIIRIELEATPGGPTGPTNPTGPTPPATDQLTADLTRLYQSDTDDQKVTHAQALGQVYSWAASAIQDPAFTTAGQFRTALGQKSSASLPTTVLLPLRQRVQTELRTVLPSQSSGQLSASTRARASQLFSKLSGIMGQVAK